MIVSEDRVEKQIALMIAFLWWLGQGANLPRVCDCEHRHVSCIDEDLSYPGPINTSGRLDSCGCGETPYSFDTPKLTHHIETYITQEEENTRRRSTASIQGKVGFMALP